MKSRIRLSLTLILGRRVAVDALSFVIFVNSQTTATMSTKATRKCTRAAAVAADTTIFGECGLLCSFEVRFVMKVDVEINVRRTATKVTEK